MERNTIIDADSPLASEFEPFDDEETVLEAYEEEMASRWRRAILRLSETFVDAADERSDLSSILLEAMHNALNNLLIYGEAGDLMALEEWLSMEDAGKAKRAGRGSDSAASPARARGADRRGPDRRSTLTPVALDRREPAERRTIDRRAVRDWQFEHIPQSPAAPPETDCG